jgi:hypothetical protein
MSPRSLALQALQQPTGQSQLSLPASRPAILSPVSTHISQQRLRVPKANTRPPPGTCQAEGSERGRHISQVPVTSVDTAINLCTSLIAGEQDRAVHAGQDKQGHGLPDIGDLSKDLGPPRRLSGGRLGSRSISPQQFVCE